MLLVALVMGLATSTAGWASLFDRGRGLVYDDDIDVTWLQDGNYARTSGYDLTGAMTWDAAVVWVTNLEFGGYSDWRLPAMHIPDSTCVFPGNSVSAGYGCTGSELSHLFYSELGGEAGRSISAVHNQNYDLFNNVQSYWYGTEYAPAPQFAWDFFFNWGGQQADEKGGRLYAWAVRDGDVTAVISEPTTVAIVSLGLIGLTVLRRKQSHSTP